MKSNCLFMTLYYKYVFGDTIKIHIKWQIGRHTWPHFYWYNRLTNKYYHYLPIDEEISCKNMLWFSGAIRIKDTQ